MKYLIKMRLKGTTEWLLSDPLRTKKEAEMLHALCLLNNPGATVVLARVTK